MPKQSSAGRPTKYNANFPEIAGRMRRMGMSGADIARAFGVHHRTFMLWRAKHRDFRKKSKALWNGQFYGKFTTGAR